MDQNKVNDLSKLALKGMLSGAFAFSATGLAVAAPNAPAPNPMAYVMYQTHSDIHDCAGKNSCKGLGGCAVDAKKLAKLSSKMGVAAGKAGEPHSCSGLNECKGLGGCSVDAGKLAKLQGKLKASAYSDIHSCAGLNTCKGLGGCGVDAKKLAKLATKAGVAADKAGEPHSCSGLNECKGLGGCSVDAKKLAKLKAKLK